MINSRNLIIAAHLGLVPGGLTLALENVANPSSNPAVFEIQGATIAFLFPGMLASVAVSANVHAFHLWVAAVCNYVIYFLLFWAMAALTEKLYRRLSASRRVNNF